MLFSKKYKKKFDVADDEFPAITTRLKAFKQKLAIMLQEKSELLSAHTKTYFLILFCVSFGGGSVGIAVHSITTKTNAGKIASITKPAHINEDKQSMLQPGYSITKQEYDRVLQFENYMLNLEKDSAGQKKFDSIIINRPQLLDSITLFKKMYLSQTKK